MTVHVIRISSAITGLYYVCLKRKFTNIFHIHLKINKWENMSLDISHLKKLLISFKMTYDAWMFFHLNK